MTPHLSLKERLDIAFRWTPVSVKRTLDLGGEIFDLGNLPKALSERGQNVHVANISCEAITKIKSCQSSNKISFAVSDACMLPYKTESFNAVIMTDVLEHVENDKHAIFEVKRILAQEGLLTLTVPYKGFWDWLDPANVKIDFRIMYSNILRLLSFVTGKGITPIIPGQRHRHYSLRMIKTLLQHDFLIQKIKRSGGVIYGLSNLVLNVLEKLNTLNFIQKFLKLLMTWDYSISYGPFSYNLSMLAVRLSETYHDSF